MDVYLKLPGYAGSATRAGHRGWLPIESLSFERPLLEKETAEFTVYRVQDALSRVLLGRAKSRRAFTRVRVHHVEGSDVLSRLRFDEVFVRAVTVVGSADEAKECVTFRAGRWQPE